MLAFFSPFGLVCATTCRTIFKSDLGNFLGEYYHDNVMRQCMTKLKEEVERAEHGGRDMIGKLAEVWTQFYTSILPTLLAFFASVQVCCLARVKGQFSC